MDYKELYIDALERAKKNYDVAQDLCDNSQIGLECFKNTLINIFPELKESKDEKIKREIVAYINELADLKNEKIPTKWLDWLEKQNKQSSSNIPSRETILAIWELGNDWKELTNGCILPEYGTQLKYIQEHWQESSYYDNIMEGNERK